MLWIFFFTVSQAKKSICICNGECHPLCATDKIDAPSSSYQINKSLLTSFKNEEEIELILYSNQKGFNFKIDSTYFNNKKTTIKALNDSQIIKLQIKTGFLPFYKTIEIKPNYKICLPSLIPLESSYSNKKKISEHISDAISSTVPISVGFLQFDRLGTSLKCTAIHKNGDFYFNENNDGNPQNFNCNTNDLTSESAHQCGISCYSDNDNLTLSYTFKGVQFALYGTENKWLGKFLIELNGEVIEEVNQNVNHGDTSIRRTLIYRSDVLPYKEYKVRLLPSKNDGNGHYEIYKLVYWPSANSKRINSTEFNEASTSWTKESDGIGGVRHYVQNGGVATLPLYCSKFWIYGMKGTDINDIEISYNDFTETINMRSFRQKDEGALLYESPDLTKFNIVLSIKATSSFLKLYCIYYEEPPIPLSVGLTQMTFDGSNNCVLRNGNVVDYNSKPDLKNLGCDYNNLDSPEAYQCGLVCTSQDGNYSYQFYGVKYAIFGHYDSNYGKFDVELDDIFITEVDESIKNQKYQLLYESDVFNFKQHTIKIISKNQMYSLYKIVYWPSIKAIRMNSSQIKGDSTGWTSETDGIGGVQEYKGGTFTMQLTCTKFWFYGVTNTHLNQVTMTSSDGISATLNQRGPRNSGVMMYESPELEYATRQLTFSVSKQPIMIYTIYYEQELPKETPIPISIGFLDLERTGSFRCGGNHLSGDADFSMSNNQLNHTSNFNCSVNDFYSVYAYQCGIRCYTSSGDYSYTFTGVKFNIYGTKADGNHEFDVELDGAIIATPNEYQKQREAYTIVYQSDVLVYKEHTVRIIHKTKQYEIYKLTYWPSVNAVRMNSTSFVKVGTWINESDGVGGLREYTNTQGDTFSTNFTSSKFWIIGTVASHLNGFKLSVNQVESDVSQKVSNRKDSTIVYQSDETSYDYTLITGTSKGVFVVAGIFYQTRPSPFEYIDRTFTTTLPYFQILVKKSQIKQISGCSFIDISEDFDYFITLEQEVLFNDNLFQCDAQGTNKPAPINIRYNGKLTLRNCTFNNSRSRTNSGGNVLYCNTEFSIEVYFISCNFQNCGNSKDCAIIDIQNSNSKINLYKCDFIFDNSDVSSMAIKSNCIAANIDNCKFIKTCGISISRSTISDASQLSITKCSFDYCGSETMNFLDLSLGQPSSIVFENINISNMIRNEGQKFTMYLKADSNIQEMELRNISFTDNSCFSLFGGGVGICIEKVNTLSFYDCTFIRNKAGSDDSNRNDMLSDIEPNYHAGDGGGIQIGFLRNLKESAVKFEQCLFKNNKAIRHGGALAIQTTSTVEIIGCTFESNEANSNIASSNLLWENHFNKKTQGRGGAIYINPSFSYTSSSSSSDIDFSMTSLTIRDCTFSKNLAIDGYAIYIEGDDPGTTFGFQNNNFNNNFNIDPDNDPNITERGVIATEIHSIVKEDVLNDNHFSHDELSSIPKEFVYVDHYGNIMPTQGFSESVPFSKTEQFSLTNDFTKSKDFSKSEQFSQSSQFSQSNPFSQSQQFSNPFSETGHFSKTEQFSLTTVFTKSNDFSDSNYFTKSNKFTVSNCFTNSNEFSRTGKFSSSKAFSMTIYFSESTKFSQSLHFTLSDTFSRSQMFSKSGHFSETNYFSQTDKFSFTLLFSKSEDLTLSSLFSLSKQFSHSRHFSNTKQFTETNHFTLTDKFTQTKHFTESQQFTKSNAFSLSSTFSLSKKFTTSGHFTLSNGFSNTNKFSSSYGFSESFAFTPSASLIPDNPLCSIIDEFGNMTLSNRCEYEGSEDHKVTVEITRSNFTDFHENEDGGAIRVKNCEVRCNGTLFLNCSSGIGGGGGIYINNTINTEINIDLINLTFIQCHAIYGGAVFIRSIHESSKILVYNCSFDSNRALGKKSIDSLYGGSALFLATRGVNLNYSTFSHSKGQGGAIRIEDCYYGLDFESKFNKRIKLSDEENMKTFSISDCYFEEEDDDSTNSILDATGNEGKEIELINCIFKGKSANEKKYINDDTKHKFHIISCSFDNDTNAVRNYIDVDVNKKPVYDIHKQVKRNSYISIIAALAISMSILVLTLIKIMKSNNNDNSYDDSYDPYE